MVAENALIILRKAKTSESLAQEVLHGELKPSLYQSGRSLTPPEDNEYDDADPVLSKIKLLLISALETGKLKSLATALVLGWRANYDSPLMRQGESILVKKASEVELEVEFEKAMEERNLRDLQACFTKALRFGLSGEGFPILIQAQQVEKELEEEARNLQEASRPETKSVYGKILGDIFKVDSGPMMEKVDKESEMAKVALEESIEKLQKSLQALQEVKQKQEIPEKISRLEQLHAAFVSINPKMLEEMVNTLREQVDHLRAENAELLLMQQEKPDCSSEELAALQERIKELEGSGEEMMEQINIAAEYGAKWMGDKMQEKINELEAQLEQARSAPPVDQEAEHAKIRAEVEVEFKRKSQELVHAEKKAKVQALDGLEKALHKKFAAEKAEMKRELKSLHERNKALRAELEKLNEKLRESTEAFQESLENDKSQRNSIK